MKYLLLLGSMALAVFGQLLLKQGVSSSSLSPTLSAIMRTLLLPKVFLGLAAYGVSAIVWLFVLQKFPLSVAYPAVSLTYVAIVILSFLLLQEPLTFLKMVGVSLIIVGTFLIFR